MIEPFIDALEKNDKGLTMKLCFEAVSNGEITVPQLYEKILAPALNRLEADEADLDDLIWREHAMSSIVRSIIEALYPQVLEERNRRGLAIDRSVLIFCPAREEHEIGARMVADFFLVLGYKVTYIGANTPEKTIIKAIERVKPDYLCISVSNPFNLFATRQLIENIRQKFGREMKIIVGGHAFSGKPDAVQQVKPDKVLQAFADVETLRGEEVSA